MSTTAEDRRRAAENLANDALRSPLALRRLVDMAAADGTRPLANSALELLETGCATAEDALSGDDVAVAVQTLVALCQRLVGLLEPYAGPRAARPSSMQGVDID